MEVKKQLQGHSSEQGARIKELEAKIERLEAKISRLETKSTTEIKNLYDGVTAITTAHARVGDIERVVHQHGRVIDKLRADVSGKMAAAEADGKFALVEDVNCLLDKKASKGIVDAALSNCVSRSELDLVKASLAPLSSLDDVLSRKVDMDTLVECMSNVPKNDGGGGEEVLAALRDRIKAVEAGVDAVRAAQAQTSSSLAPKSDVASLQQALKRVVELQGTNNVELQNEVSKLRMDMLSRVPKGNNAGSGGSVDEKIRSHVDKLASDVKVAIKGVQREIVEVLNRKAFKKDVHESLKLKADLNEMIERIKRKADASDVRALQSATARLDGVSKEMDAIDRKLEQKANVDDVCALLDQKANVDDVNAALEEMQNAQNEQATKLLEESRVLAKKQEAEEASKASAPPPPPSAAKAKKSKGDSSIVGRWIWKTGVKSQQSVPWNVQTTNTAQDALLWSPSTTSIVAQIPGLYELTIGFFSEHDPSVQIFVNGELALSFSPKSGKRLVARRGSHSAGNVTGWTHVDFVALPRQARVSVAYDGDASAQGFLGLRKL